MEESKLKSAKLLEQKRVHLASGAGKELAEKVGFVYQLNISPKKLGVDEEVFVVDLKKVVVSKGPYEGKPDATFSFTDDDFLAISSGKLNPQMAFIRGKLKIKGSIARRRSSRQTSSPSRPNCRKLNCTMPRNPCIPLSD